MAYWESAKAAAEFYKFSNQVVISYNVNGITKQAKGHYFRYASAKETDVYQKAMRRIDAIAVPAPVVTAPIADSFPVDTIPELAQKPDDQGGALSLFDRLLQKSKKNFNENSE